MWYSHTSIGWRAYMKVVVSRGLLTTIVIFIHRMMMAMMQAELLSWQNTLRHNHTRSASTTSRFGFPWWSTTTPARGLSYGWPTLVSDCRPDPTRCRVPSGST
jgi:hypothetical protein